MKDPCCCMHSIHSASKQRLQQQVHQVHPVCRRADLPVGTWHVTLDGRDPEQDGLLAPRAPLSFAAAPNNDHDYAQLTRGCAAPQLSSWVLAKQLTVLFGLRACMVKMLCHSPPHACCSTTLERCSIVCQLACSRDVCIALAHTM